VLQVLKQRILTALLLLPLVMALIFALPAPWFPILLGGIFLGGSWEYQRLAGLSGRASAYMLMVIQIIILALLYRYRDYWESTILMDLVASCVIWLLMFIRLFRFKDNAKVTSSYRWISFTTAILSITIGWFSLSWIRFQTDGAWLILLLLLTVWAADVGAYFAGKIFGKTRLAPHISPGKTRAGLVGGLFFAPLVTLLAANLMPLGHIEAVYLILLSFVTALVSVGGDLMISLHKRTSGFKDSGNLLPGHGGILDRLDSLLVASPFFALGLLILGY
jgi:phosphatidate cytidylyltransferase